MFGDLRLQLAEAAQAGLFMYSRRLLSLLPLSACGNDQSRASETSDAFTRTKSRREVESLVSMRYDLSAQSSLKFRVMCQRPPWTSDVLCDMIG